MTALAVVAKACGIALLMGALLGAWAWSALDEPRRSAILRQARWLVIPGYVGLFLWVLIFGYGVFARGCDPAFGGWIRTPLFQGFIASEILSCAEVPLQARGKPELRAEFPNLPEQWSQVYGHYDDVSGFVSDSGKVWIATLDNRVYHVAKTQLEFRAVPSPSRKSVVAARRGERVLVIPPWLRGFALDLRSLALFRIVMGLCLLGSLIRRLSEAGTFYSDSGVLPANVLLRDRENILSLHLISDAVEIQYAIFLIAIAFAIAFTVGYKTRLAVIVSWLLWVSMLARNPLATHAGDHELRLLLFWSMFLPLNGAWAVDSPRFRPLTQLSTATVALILQIGAVYWFAAAEKMGPAWVSERSAVYYALHIDMVATPLGVWLRGLPEATRWMTVATLALELLGPFLVISPWRTNACRLAAVVLFMGFHLGIGLTMRLGLFAWISALAWVVFLPGSVWRPRVDGQAQERSLVRDALVVVSVLLAAYHLMAPRPRPSAIGEASSYHQLALMLGWEQRWPMFAPRPSTMNPWWIVEGVTPDEKRLDLWAGETPGVKPATWDAAYRSVEWVGYMFQVLGGTTAHHEALAHYFCRERNGPRLGIARAKMRLIDSVSVTVVVDPIAAPGRPALPEERRVLWAGPCP